MIFWTFFLSESRWRCWTMPFARRTAATSRAGVVSASAACASSGLTRWFFRASSTRSLSASLGNPACLPVLLEVQNYSTHHDRERESRASSCKKTSARKLVAPPARGEERVDELLGRIGREVGREDPEPLPVVGGEDARVGHPVARS